MAEQKSADGDDREPEERPASWPVGEPPEHGNGRRIDKNLGVVVEARQQEDLEPRAEQAEHDPAGRARGEPECQRRTEGDHGGAEGQLRQRPAPEQELDGRADVEVERRPVIDEIAHRQLAKQDLPAANQVEKVIVGQSGEAAVGIVEAEEPGEDEDARSGRGHREAIEISHVMQDRIMTSRHAPSPHVNVVSEFPYAVASE